MTMNLSDSDREPRITVTDTGQAQARDRGTAVTGLSGGAGGIPDIALVSGTGDAIAIGGSVANTGFLVINLDAELAAARVVCPPSVMRLPARSDLFVGRVRELVAVDDALASNEGVVVHAVHGLGGIGKSTLARQWAATRGSQHNPVWWIAADSPASIDAGLAALATALQPALAAALPQDALREWAIQWLTSHDGWLLVLDNVADPADIRSLLARANTGRFLITSRRATGWQGIATQVSLGVLSLAEAAELFAVARPQDPRTDVDHPVQFLPTMRAVSGTAFRHAQSCSIHTRGAERPSPRRPALGIVAAGAVDKVAPTRNYVATAAHLPRNRRILADVDGRLRVPHPCRRGLPWPCSDVEHWSRCSHSVRNPCASDRWKTPRSKLGADRLVLMSTTAEIWIEAER